MKLDDELEYEVARLRYPVDTGIVSEWR